MWISGRQWFWISDSFNCRLKCQSRSMLSWNINDQMLSVIYGRRKQFMVWNDCRQPSFATCYRLSYQLPIIAVTMAIPTSKHEKKSFKLSTYIPTWCYKKNIRTGFTYITYYGVSSYINDGMELFFAFVLLSRRSSLSFPWEFIFLCRSQRDLICQRKCSAWSL